MVRGADKKEQACIRLVIWVISDGRPGHVNQSLGLAEALARRVECEIHRLEIPAGGSWWGRLRVVLKQSESLARPDMILGTGHRTHLALWWLKKRTGAHAVVMMKPSLPIRFFDTCIVPRHDFAGGVTDERVVLTKGAMNRVKAGIGEKQGRLILVGGESKTHAWDGEQLEACLEKITRNGEWEMTDSRRSPSGWLEKVRQKLPNVKATPHQETDGNWVPSHLAMAEEVWVTEDSVSMIYEALTSGARVGLLPMPRRKQETRVLRGIEAMVADGYVTTYGEWETTGALKKAPEVLAEADRCAALVLKKTRRES